MAKDLATVNRDLEQASPALYASLSSLGRRVYFPPDIPAQAADARGKLFNGTIGQITDGRGHAVALPAMLEALSGLPDDSIDAALLYSPLPGRPPAREGWRQWQRRGVDPELPSSLPIVTVGLTHGLSLIADLFGGEGRAVAIPTPYWGNYRQTFEVRTGAGVVTAPAFREGRYQPQAIEDALQGLPAGEPAVGLLNLPSNPTGYMPTPEERESIRASLMRVAEKRPLIVICDDAYSGLIYEPGIPARSMFWELIEQHEQLVPIKVDGATKELSFFGGRVGFLSFPFAPGSAAEAAIESKVKCLSRATVGSPVGTSQLLVEGALSAAGIAAQVERVRSLLEGRYRVLREALAGVDHELLRPIPFNAGCFAVVELPEGLDPERVRRHLLEHHDTGLVSIQPSYLRIAHSSIAAESLPELVRRLETGVGECLAPT